MKKNILFFIYINKNKKFNKTKYSSHNQVSILYN